MPLGDATPDAERPNGVNPMTPRSRSESAGPATDGSSSASESVTATAGGATTATAQASKRWRWFPTRSQPSAAAAAEVPQVCSNADAEGPAAAKPQGKRGAARALFGFGKRPHAQQAVAEPDERLRDLNNGCVDSEDEDRSITFARAVDTASHAAGAASQPEHAPRAPPTIVPVHTDTHAGKPPRRSWRQGLGISTNDKSASTNDLISLGHERFVSAPSAAGSEAGNTVGAPRQVVSTGGDLADRERRNAMRPHRRTHSFGWLWPAAAQTSPEPSERGRGSTSKGQGRKGAESSHGGAPYKTLTSMSCFGMSTVADDGDPAPPAQIDGLTKGTAGLENIGNTCFLNAALQGLRSTPGLLQSMAPELLADPSLIPPDPPGLLRLSLRPTRDDDASDELPVRPHSAMAGSTAHSVAAAYANLPKPSSADSTLQRFSNAHTADLGDRLALETMPQELGEGLLPGYDTTDAAVASDANSSGCHSDAGSDRHSYGEEGAHQAGSAAAAQVGSEPVPDAADAELANLQRVASGEATGVLGLGRVSSFEQLNLPGPLRNSPTTTAVIGGVALTTPPIAEHPGSAATSADRVEPLIALPECAELRAELQDVLPKSQPAGRLTAAQEDIDGLQLNTEQRAGSHDADSKSKHVEPGEDEAAADEGEKRLAPWQKRVASDKEVATSFLHVMVKLAALEQPTVLAPRALMCNIRDNPTGVEYANGGHHDSQELLNWCLQVLSEANNRVAAAPAASPATADALQASSTLSAAKTAEGASAERPNDEHISPRQQAETEWREALSRESSAVLDSFQGQLQSCVVCSKCGTPSYTYEAFTSLALAPHKDGKGLKAKFTGRTLDRIEDCLKAYVQEERLENGAQAFACSKCDAKTSATKTLRIQRFPASLILHIKRFKLSSNVQLSAQERWIKFTGNVSFPHTGLNLSAFASESSGAGADDAMYDLYAVINHIGSRDVGHCTAYCKIQGAGKEQLWYKFDDEKVTQVSADAVNSSAAYILMYCRRPPAAQQTSARHNSDSSGSHGPS